MKATIRSVGRLIHASAAERRRSSSRPQARPSLPTAPGGKPPLAPAGRADDLDLQLAVQRQPGSPARHRQRRRRQHRPFDHRRRDLRQPVVSRRVGTLEPMTDGRMSSRRAARISRSRVKRLSTGSRMHGWRRNNGSARVREHRSGRRPARRPDSRHPARRSNPGDVQLVARMRAACSSRAAMASRPSRISCAPAQSFSISGCRPARARAPPRSDTAAAARSRSPAASVTSPLLARRTAWSRVSPQRPAGDGGALEQRRLFAALAAGAARAASNSPSVSMPAEGLLVVYLERLSGRVVHNHFRAGPTHDHDEVEAARPISIIAITAAGSRLRATSAASPWTVARSSRGR